eukprot:TRINITY_DN13679_c0_g3_i1.p1 TRINITY_DN13679_c0_g3~~TRINITY_DN13679_c0_g3_i1.p1  ORF type:complete len:573 (-),score=80.79 TRINITY_DN13679_c0_g3_i1:84-1592(-)
MMLIALIPRVVRFLIAAKSLGRAVIGDLARMAQAIGVARPQDLVKAGTGSVSLSQDGAVIVGRGTSFLQELSPGFKVVVGGEEFLVRSVESADRCTVEPPSTGFASFVDSKYKVMPKVDQHSVYNTVHEALRSGDCIGIFPEGGSHDQTSMLELKPGVAVMALGAMQAGAHNVQICPCGLNYYEPYKFRSRVVVEFGQPIKVPMELAEQYKVDRRGAVQALMNLVQEAMVGVVPGARNYEEMQAIVTMRALWKPRDRKISPAESLKITKTFAKGIKKFQSDERVSAIIQEVQEYNDALHAARCRDRDVRKNLMTRKVLLLLTIRAVVVVVALLPLALVCYVIFSPVAAVTYFAAMREKRTALANSKVKVKALDVVASQKIKVALVVMPLYEIFLSAVAAWLTSTGWLGFLISAVLVLPISTLVATYVCDSFAKACVHCQTNFGRRRIAKPLLEHRAQLQRRIRALVEELGPQVVDDFSHKRIISAEELARDNDLLQPLLGGP